MKVRRRKNVDETKKLKSTSPRRVLLKLVIMPSQDGDDNDENEDDADEDHRFRHLQGKPCPAGDLVRLLWKNQPSSQCDVRRQGDNLNVWIGNMLEG